MAMLDQQSLSSLLEWFYDVREPYLFRQQRNAYRVWIAEVVLQQTRIQAALEPLRRFFSAFPTLESLAGADEVEVLRAFRGLGYYARAKNIHRGARYLVAHGGKFPETCGELVRIPSIGPYTAAAISSICYGERRPAVDANVKRILSRLYRWRYRQNRLAQASGEALEKIFADMAHHPGDVNEALMELGQKICTRSSPGCEICPLSPRCLAHRTGTIAKYPHVAPKPARVPVLWHLYLLKNGGEVLLQKWQDFYFLKGHLAFPSILEFPATGEFLASWETARKFDPLSAKSAFGGLEELPPVKHAITRHDIRILSYTGQCHDPSLIPHGRWVDIALVESSLVASALLKVWGKFLQHDSPQMFRGKFCPDAKK